MQSTRRAVAFARHANNINSLHFAPVATVQNGFRRYCSCSAPRPAAQPSSSAPELDTTATTPPRPPADHRNLATQQQLFITSPYSPGSPLYLPNGAALFNKLQNFLRAQYAVYGFKEVITPTIYKKSLWQASGHWDNYAADMFSVTGRGAAGTKEDQQIGEDEEFGLKPMNCPGHCLLFKSQKRSYKDLPVRYADFGALHRNEVSGSLSGLTRVRRFHQDDGHIFCRPSQIAEEIEKSLKFVGMVYKTFGLGPYKMVLSTRPEEYIGRVEEWDRAEAQLRSALKTTGKEWTISDGDGAFYGPKIDIILTDSDGKEHQTATIQLDLQLPQRFELGYVAPAPEFEAKGQLDQAPQEDLDRQGLVTPVIIHRAILGSLERFMALLIEHYNGVYPFWLTPRPLIILSVTQNRDVLEYVDAAQAFLSRYTHDKNFAEFLRDRSTTGASSAILQQESVEQDRIPPYSYSLSVDTDVSARPLGKKVQEARKSGYAIIVVIGEKDLTSEHVQVEVANIRDRTATLEWVNGKGYRTSKDRHMYASIDGLKDVCLNFEKQFM